MSIHRRSLQALEDRLEAMASSVEALKRDLEYNQAMLMRLMELQVEPWRLEYLRDGWSHDEVDKVAEFLRMEKTYPREAPIVTAWSKLYPDVAKKFFARNAPNAAEGDS
ncbi:MAG: hypothetical protein L0210_10045, partial [Rhodospirillales bacterium]|nr:hypothetical protein [Rhodospirillales bacterium]